MQLAIRKAYENYELQEYFLCSPLVVVLHFAIQESSVKLAVRQACGSGEFQETHCCFRLVVIFFFVIQTCRAQPARLVTVLNIRRRNLVLAFLFLVCIVIVIEGYAELETTCRQ